MKPIILIPIIIGSVLLTAGATVFAVAVANANKVEPQTFEYKLDDKEFANFNFDLDTSDVEFVVSNEKKVVVTETKNVVHDVVVSDNTLIVKQKDNRKWYQYAFSFVQFKIRATVYLPAGTYGDFKFNNHTGDLLVPNNYTFNNVSVEEHTGNVNMKTPVNNTVNIKASTGNITLADMNPKSLNIKVDTGNVKLDNMNVEGDIKSESSTGNQKLTGIRCTNLNIKTSTGNQSLTDVVASKVMTLRASTGDIKLDGCDGIEKIDIKTSTGFIKGTILTGKVFIASSSTAKPHVPENDRSGGDCILETSTGAINISIKG